MSHFDIVITVSPTIAITVSPTITLKVKLNDYCLVILSTMIYKLPKTWYEFR